ncbi:response regulator [Sphingomonas jatrophae]|uniref:Response regulator receiver domain-containing protein n=1 Tax=Sphingomonas jatrophae TaxID=1166337 RepID=A0A1I6JNI4_9SPHN|nr:response regulator [Sphingomonas jatrophae]SFR80499.1 Response regulator receiver domain-containing protein [Sphingomonas jatrophae]
MNDRLNVPSRSLNLLIVEDEALIAMMVEDALALHGHVIVGIAEDVASALDLADAHHVDFALCDVRLANGDSGVDAAIELGRRGIPVVYLSGNCPPSAAHRLVVGCISKPFHTASLNASVLAAFEIAGGASPDLAPTALTLYR